MTTYWDLIEDARNELMTGQPDRVNVLDSNITNSVDTLTLRYTGKGIADGSILVIGVEEMRVITISNTGASSTVTVIRGSNAVAHNAGDTVYVNPQFSSKRIAGYVNAGLDNISGDGLFQILNATAITSTIAFSYDLGTLPNFLSVWRVRYDEVGPANAWPVLRPDEYYVDQSPNSTDFTGPALFLKSGVPLGRRIQVTYKAGFNRLTNLTDDVETVSGLHREAHDIPALYAAMCMLAGREVKRSFTNRQPEPRRAEEVPAGHANQAMLPLLHRYEDRIKVEKKRLHRKYPGAT